MHSEVLMEAEEREREEEQERRRAGGAFAEWMVGERWGRRRLERGR